MPDTPTTLPAVNPYDYSKRPATGSPKSYLEDSDDALLTGVIPRLKALAAERLGAQKAAPKPKD